MAATHLLQSGRFFRKMESSGNTCWRPCVLLYISWAFLVVYVTTQSMSADICQEITRAMSEFSISARWPILPRTSGSSGAGARPQVRLGVLRI